MGRRLYVGNLPYTTGEAELQELFSKSGTVESVRVMRDAATGRARGFAFVEMATDEEAQKAASEFNQYQMGGRALTGRRLWRRWRQPWRWRGWRRTSGTALVTRCGGVWENDEELVQRRSRLATNLRSGHARRGQRTSHGDRFR